MHLSASTTVLLLGLVPGSALAIYSSDCQSYPHFEGLSSINLLGYHYSVFYIGLVKPFSVRSTR